MEFQLYGIVLFAVTALAFVGCALMTAAFAVVIRRWSWDAAMKLDECGKWPIARKLMVAGASLGVAVGVLFVLLIEWWKRLIDP